MSKIKDFYIYSDELKSLGINLPKYEKKGTSIPTWIHFGGGNLYRGFHAEIAQKLLNENKLKSGVIVGETFDDEVVEKVYKAFDNNLLQVIMHEDGRLEKNIINSTESCLFVHPEHADYNTFSNYFIDKSLQMVTFSITEKGYNIFTSNGELLSIVEEDIEEGPTKGKHTMSIVTALLLKRYTNGTYPISMVSTDNFSRNGEKFQDSILTIAKGWVKSGFAEDGFIAYLTDANRVSFPWTMIDRITPNPSKEIEKQLKKEGITDATMIRTKKGTNIASFSNTESVHYLVIEDRFPNGRPELEKAGVILTDRETVEKTDAMKVATCLNPLHTALALFGQLLGYSSISEEMKNPDLVLLIKGIGYKEGLPVVDDPIIIDPRKFIDEVVYKRLPNPMIPDTPQRIATDTSQKMSIRYGETIKKYMKSSELDSSELEFIPFTIAGWIRLLVGIDDNGEIITLSPDPLLDELQNQIKTLHLGSGFEEIHENVQPILSNQTIFGIDLYQANLGGKIESYLHQLLEGKTAVSNSLHKLITDKGE